jgi:hypothetical protein
MDFKKKKKVATTGVTGLVSFNVFDAVFQLCWIIDERLSGLALGLRQLKRQCT